MVANGQAMQAIMEATQEETKASRNLAIKAQKLTESMKKDSLSMKTVSRIDRSTKTYSDVHADSRVDHVLSTRDLIRCPAFNALLQ